ncbi:hypothetical protein HZS_4618 [Henneguya salminicola]|nr:hypothetical protein HZS_4618 [Henneguya salminicola]
MFIQSKPYQRFKKIFETLQISQDPRDEKIKTIFIENCSLEDFLIIISLSNIFSLKFAKNDLEKNKTGSVEIIVAIEQILKKVLRILKIIVTKILIYFKQLKQLAIHLKRLFYINNVEFQFYTKSRKKTCINKYFILLTTIAVTFGATNFPLDPIKEKISGFQKTQY